MNVAGEIRRRRLLEAMGVDCYVSRFDLPGAAPVQRRVLKLAVPAAESRAPDPSPMQALRAGNEAGKPAAGHESRAPQRAEPVVRGSSAPDEASAGKTAPSPRAQVAAFSLAVVAHDDTLWIEDLGDLPLMKEQVQLIAGMAAAVGRSVTPDIGQFDWPMYGVTPQQPEVELEMALSGFLARRLENHEAATVLLLGDLAAQRCGKLLPAQQPTVRLPATRAMLANVDQKRVAWEALKTHLLKR